MVGWGSWGQDLKQKIEKIPKEQLDEAAAAQEAGPPTTEQMQEVEQQMAPAHFQIWESVLEGGPMTPEEAEEHGYEQPPPTPQQTWMLEEDAAEWSAEQVADIEEQRAEYIEELYATIEADMDITLAEAYATGEGVPLAAHIAEHEGLAEIERWYRDAVDAVDRAEQEYLASLIGDNEYTRLSQETWLAGKTWRDLFETGWEMSEFIGPLAEGIPESDRPATAYQVVLGFAEGVTEEEAAAAYSRFLEATRAEFAYIGTPEAPGPLALLHEKNQTEGVDADGNVITHEQFMETLYDTGEALGAQISELITQWGETPELFREIFKDFRKQQKEADIPTTTGWRGWIDRIVWGYETGGGAGRIGRALAMALDPVSSWYEEHFAAPWSTTIYEAYTLLPGYQRGEERFREVGGLPNIFSLFGAINPVAHGRAIWEWQQTGNPAEAFRSYSGIMFGGKMFTTQRQREKMEIYEDLGSPGQWGIEWTHPVMLLTFKVGVPQVATGIRAPTKVIATASGRAQAVKIIAQSSRATTIVKVSERVAAAPFRAGAWGVEFAGRTGGRTWALGTAPARLSARGVAYTARPATRQLATKMTDEAVMRAVRSAGLGVVKEEGPGGLKYLIQDEGFQIYARNLQEVAHYALTKKQTGIGRLFIEGTERYYVPSLGRIVTRGELAELPKGTKYFVEEIFRFKPGAKGELPPVVGLTDDIWAKGVTQFATESLSALAHMLNLTMLPPLEVFIDVAIRATFAKRVAGKFREVPALRNVLNKINPNIFVTHEDRVLSAAAGWYQMGAAWEMAVKMKVAEIRAIGKVKINRVKQPDGTVRPYVDGVTVRANAPKGTEALVGDVFEHPEWFHMNQRLEQIIRSSHDLIDEATEILHRYGIKVNELGFEPGGHYFPRYVLKKVENGVELAPTYGVSGKKGLMGEAHFEKTRIYDTMKEGIDNGFVYMDDPMNVLETHLMTVGRRVCDAEFKRMMGPMGLTEAEMLELIAPGLKLQTQRLATKLQAAKDLPKLIQRAKRGEKLHAATIAKIARLNPKIAQQLKTTKPKQRNAQFWDSLTQEAKNTIAVADDAFKASQAKLAKSRLTVKGKAPWRNLAAAGKKNLDKMNAKWQADAAKRHTLEVNMKAALNAGNTAKHKKLAKEYAKLTDKLPENQRRLEELIRKAEGFNGKTARRVEDYGFSGTWFPEDTAAEINAVLSQETSKYLRVASNTNALFRFMMTGMDFGASMIQGLPLLMMQPDKWVEAQLRSLGVFGANMVGRGETVYSRYLAKETSQRAAAEALQSGRSLVIGGTEFTESMVGGGYLGRLRRLPIVKPTFGRVTQSYAMSFEMFGDVARIELYNSLRHMAKTTEEIGDLVDFVNKATGVTSTKALGIPASQRQIEGALILFAPRYFRATTALQLDIVRGGLRGAAAREAVAAMAASGLIYYYATCKALGQEPNLDPRSGGFMTVTIGGTHIGIGSMWVANMRFLANMYSTAERYPDQGIPWKIWESNTRRDNPMWKYISGRVAPITSTTIDIVTGETYIGEPIDTPWDMWEHAIQRNLLPFWLDAQLSEDPRPGWAAVPAEMFGMRAWAEQPWEIANNLQNKYAQERFNKAWADCSKLEREILIQDYPDLRDARIRAQERRVERGDELDEKISQYFKDIDDLQDEQVKYYEMAVDQFEADLELKLRLLNGDTTLTKEEIVRAENAGLHFREAIKDADMSYGRAYGRLIETEAYAEVQEYFAELEETGEEPQLIADRCYLDYVTRLYGNSELYKQSTTLEDGTVIYANYDYEKADSVRMELLARWGTDLIADAEKLLRLRKPERPEQVDKYKEAIHTLQPYWAIEQKMEGLYPDMTKEELDAWKEERIVEALRRQAPHIAHMYQTMQVNETYADMVRAEENWPAIGALIESIAGPIRRADYPTLNRVVTAARLQWRMDNPKGDELLMLFYDKKPLGEREPAEFEAGPAPPEMGRVEEIIQWR